MALDPCRVGEILLNWVNATATLGHVSPRNTSVYIHPLDEEGEFVRAMMDGARTMKILERWPDLSEARHYPEGQLPVRESRSLRAVNGQKRPKKDPGFGRLERRP